jgi:uncharacterized radical SAM protein YgiQ
MQYDIIFISGDRFFDHPLCGIAILKKLLEKEGFSVGIIDQPKKENDLLKLGKPKLFFAVTSGSMDSMVRNYTPLKKKRDEDKNLKFTDSILDRAIIVYCNWIKHLFKGSKIVLGGIEATLRRFTHYDYWDNKLRKPILFDTRADILVYGCAEKQILEIANRIKDGNTLDNIEGTCLISKEIPGNFTLLPSFEEVSISKEKFCDMQNLFSNNKNLAQKIDNRYMIQFKSPIYTTKDLDIYYSLPFTRKVPKELEGFRWSIVTHRGCIGNCNFCSLRLTQGDKIISRSETSIINEIKQLIKRTDFKGTIDDFGGPSANMYGMDCNNCDGDCLGCKVLDKSNNRLISLLRKAREIPGIKKIIIRSGVRFDLATDEYLKEIVKYHILDTLRIAPEHVNKQVLKLMNKDKGDLKQFIKRFNKLSEGRQLSFYFMTAHPGSSMKEAKELADAIKSLKNAETVQVFTPTPMTVSTCMYYTGMDPNTKKKIYVPYTYNEKKEQKRVLFEMKAKEHFYDHY